MGSGICLAFFLFIAYDYWYYWKIPSLTPDYRNNHVLPSAPRIKFDKLMNILKNSWRKGTKLLSQLLCIGAVFTACTDDEVINQADKAPLQVSVNTSLAKQSRAIVHGEWLPSGSTIGMSLFDTEGDDYDGQGYYNIQYKATGAEEAQTWASMGVTPAVSANEAVLVAYHPYNDDEDLDIFAMPVEIASQTDYMYSGSVTGITNAAPKADIVLDHALTAIRVKLVLGDFTGDASVSEIAVASPALASAATLNAADGSLDNIVGQGDKFALPVNFGLVAGGTDNDIMFVPDAAVASGVTTVSATIGGKKYTAGIECDQAYKQGYIYTYTLTLNNSGFAVTKVNVKPWETGTDNSAVLQPEKDNTYCIKIIASYSQPAPTSYIEGDEIAYNNNSSVVQSRSGETFYFHHNVSSEFVGTIDWGDGIVETYTEEQINSTKGHSYPNDGQENTITAKGDIKSLKAFDDSFRQCLKEIIYIGDCGIISMEGAFYECTNLTIIPGGLFDHCTEVTNFERTFYGCKSLTSIPVGLFDNCTEVTSFKETFAECYGLTSIPEGLFDKCTKVTTFALTFRGGYYVMNLNSIPKGLFDNCTEVTNFGGTFLDCAKIEEIPEGLFDKCTKVTTFSAEGMSVGYTSCSPGLFAGCKGLTSIPAGLFDACTEVTNFVGMFLNCDNLQTIPEGLFENNTKVTSFEGTFEDCDNLQTIPEGLFDYNNKVTDFEATFWGCDNLMGESPYTVIQVDGVDTKVHLYERENYPEYFTAPTSYNRGFYFCSKLDDYNSIPSDWK